MVRVGFQNIANLPEEKNTSKSRQLFNYIIEKSVDVFMMAEVGLCWKKIGVENQWFERTFGKFQSSQATFANNNNELSKTKKVQLGGFAMISTNNVTHKVLNCGRDPTGLKRWVWTQLLEKIWQKIKVISAYQPSKKADMEQAFITENEQQFSQSHSTPPMVQLLVLDLGFLADTDAAKTILDGMHDVPEDPDPFAKLLIQELATPESLRNGPALNHQISTEAHITY